MFKKRKVEKKSDINKDLEEIPENQGQETIHVPKFIESKKINKFSNKIQKNPQPEPVQTKAKVRYGLIDKQQVNAKHHANLQSDKPKKPQSNSLIDLYVKKKMDEINTNIDNDKKIEDNATSEIINLQKKYLELEKSKLASYDPVEIQRKLENKADLAIKNQLLARTNYLRDLLENQHERMEYASKKELKTMRQEKERLERNFQSKYNQSGRRSYVEKIKYNAIIDKK